MQGKWQNRQIFKDTHKDDLERRAALKEFEDGMPRKQAEDAAYQEYLTEHHSAAAAHHLRGLRAAQASGDIDEARIHGEAYHQHMTKLGHDSMDQVPDSIAKLVEDEGKPRHYKFKAHAADALLMKEDSDGEPEDQKTVG